MALDLITGHQGVAHISAEQISDINKAMMNGYGDNKVMRMSGGAITQNALTLEIATGYWRANGFDIQIQESETHYIDPSTIGTSRIDNIYVELLQDIPTGAQRAEITIIMGEEAASPVAPEDPTEPYLNTDILLDAVQIGTVTVTEGAMVFTDLTEAYDLVTPSELSAVQTLANNALGMIQDESDAYSSSKAYAVGDLCIHGDKVYKCITACSAAAWSVNQNCFSETTLTDEVSTLKDALNNKLNQFAQLWVNNNSTSDFAVQNIEISNLNLYSWFLVIFRSSKTSTIQYIEIVQNNRQSIITYFYDYSASLAPTYNNRILHPGVETNKFFISNNTQVLLTTGDHGTNNGIQIPTAIYGIH